MKKIIFSLILFFVVGFLSCSMWDDVDKNAAFEIPVAENINVTTVLNSAQWVDIPLFLKNDKSKNSASQYAINFVKIATNKDKTKLLFYVEMNGSANIWPPYYIINLSNDYTCSGYVIETTIGSASPEFYGKLCSTVAVSSTIGLTTTLTAGSSSAYEVSIDMPTAGFSLNSFFLVSVYASSAAIPASTPASFTGSSTTARWAKLK